MGERDLAVVQQDGGRRLGKWPGRQARCRGDYLALEALGQSSILAKMRRSSEAFWLVQLLRFQMRQYVTADRLVSIYTPAQQLHYDRK